jgi:hypothetical protein
MLIGEESPYNSIHAHGVILYNYYLVADFY